MARGKKAAEKKDAGKTAAPVTETQEQTDGTTPAPETPEQTKDTTPAPETPEQTKDTTPALETQERTEGTATAQERDLFAGIQNPCVYCGPTMRGVARQYTTYQGGIPDALRNFIKEHPEARQLIVSTEQFPAYRRRLDTPGTAEAELYKRVKEQLTGTPRKPSEAGFVGEGGARERV